MIYDADLRRRFHAVVSRRGSLLVLLVLTVLCVITWLASWNRKLCKSRYVAGATMTRQHGRCEHRPASKPPTPSPTSEGKG